MQLHKYTYVTERPCRQKYLRKLLHLVTSKRHNTTKDVLHCNHGSFVVAKVNNCGAYF